MAGWQERRPGGAVQGSAVTGPDLSETAGAADSGGLMGQNPPAETVPRRFEDLRGPRAA